MTHRQHVAYVAVNECMQVFVINYYKQELTVSVYFVDVPLDVSMN